MNWLGVTRQNESQRRERQVSATRPDSSTTWSTLARVRCQLVASPACPPPMIATSTLRSMTAAIVIGSWARGLFDQVALGRLDFDPSRLEVGDPAVQLVRLAGDLEQDPALVAADVSAANVGHKRELLAELVDHRLLHHGRPEDQLQPPPPHKAESKPATALRPRQGRSRSRPSREPSPPAPHRAARPRRSSRR